MTFSSGGTESNFNSIKAALAILFGVDTSEITLSVKSQHEIGCTIKATTENDAKRVINIINESSFVNDVNAKLNEISVDEVVLSSTSNPTCEGFEGSVTCGGICECSK